jgi:hypothetical protein
MVFWSRRCVSWAIVKQIKGREISIQFFEVLVELDAKGLQVLFRCGLEV